MGAAEAPRLLAKRDLQGVPAQFVNWTSATLAGRRFAGICRHPRLRFVRQPNKTPSGKAENPETIFARMGNCRHLPAARSSVANRIASKYGSQSRRSNTCSIASSNVIPGPSEGRPRRCLGSGSSPHCNAHRRCGPPAAVRLGLARRPEVSAELLRVKVQYRRPAKFNAAPVIRSFHLVPVDAPGGGIFVRLQVEDRRDAERLQRSDVCRVTGTGADEKLW